jgi:2-polyprenyl-3-methyl-5-hydroxy-6-metoxy-1,4-benzoquinol methylase
MVPTITRKALPQNYLKIYDEFYKEYANSTSLFRKLSRLAESWYHRQVAKWGNHPSKKILEIGCGALNHVPYEKNCEIYDVVEPKSFLIEKEINPYYSHIANYYEFLEDIEPGKLYSKIISIACLEHVTDLTNHVATVKKHLSPNGFFVVAIPAEGEFLWWIAWRLTTGLGFWLKHKLDYGIIMKYEHVNQAREILEILRSSFTIKRIRSFPLGVRHIRLYIAIECVNTLSL